MTGSGQRTFGRALHHLPMLVLALALSSCGLGTSSGVQTDHSAASESALGACRSAGADSVSLSMIAGRVLLRPSLRWYWVTKWLPDGGPADPPLDNTVMGKVVTTAARSGAKPIATAGLHVDLSSQVTLALKRNFHVAIGVDHSGKYANYALTAVALASDGTFAFLGDCARQSVTAPLNALITRDASLKQRTAASGIQELLERGRASRLAQILTAVSSSGTSESTTTTTTPFGKPPSTESAVNPDDIGLASFDALVPVRMTLKVPQGWGDASALLVTSIPIGWNDGYPFRFIQDASIVVELRVSDDLRYDVWLESDDSGKYGAPVLIGQVDGRKLVDETKQGAKGNVLALDAHISPDAPPLGDILAGQSGDFVIVDGGAWSR